MQSLESMFEAQQQMLGGAPEQDEEDTYDVFVRFEIDESWFMVPICKVRVVIDHPTIVPYPERVEGHIGVASLRGEVLPVIGVGTDTTKFSSDDPELRLMFLEFTPGSAFGILVRRPKKVHLPHRSVANLDIVNVGGEPTHLINDATSLLTGACA